ncbi:hypothetical protein [Mucilaginibacter sp. UR6-11]|uniref:hypothetical protein n=1 Tax=Mucilaginibacter sp. UR6-11 TaxID=1435644 RepID=UPI001E5BD6AD|nr:hypothetical protein [Mucilaginibacter sp. UR6-11]
MAPLKDYLPSACNLNAGYMPAGHEFENGGYETWRGRTINPQANAEAIIRENYYLW